MAWQWALLCADILDWDEFILRKCAVSLVSLGIFFPTWYISTTPYHYYASHSFAQKVFDRFDDLAVSGAFSHIIYVAFETNAFHFSFFHYIVDRVAFLLSAYHAVD